MPQQHRSKIIAAIVAFLVIAWMASGIFNGEQPAETVTVADKQDKAAALDTVDSVQTRTLSTIERPETITVNGRTEAFRRSRLSSEISGQINQVMASDGAILNEGDIIATINVDDRAATVSSAENRVRQYEIEYTTAQKLLDRGFSTAVEVATKKAELESARAALNRARLDLNNTKIRAPFNGVLEERMVEEGDYVQLGTQIAEFIDLNPIKAVGFIAEQRIGAIALGQTGRVILPSGDAYDGKVSFISRTADPATRTFRIELTVDNPDLNIADGLTSKIILQGRTRRAHEISPSVLTLDDDGNVGVKYVIDGIVAFKPVNITSSDPQSILVTGLPDPVQLIIVGQDFVSAGDAVTTVDAASESFTAEEAEDILGAPP